VDVGDPLPPALDEPQREPAVVVALAAAVDGVAGVEDEP
jgi:hypothetical protein